MKEIKIHKRKDLQEGMRSTYHTIISVDGVDFEYVGDKLKLIEEILTYLGYKVVK